MNFGTTGVSPNDLLGQLEDWLKLRTSLSSDACFLSMADDDTLLILPPADKFIAIFPESMPPWQSVVAGAGRSNTGYDAVVRVTAFCRLTTDQETRSSQLLRSRSLGVLALAGNLVNALQFWTAPVGGDSTVSYLREYARIVRGPTFRPKRLKESLWSLVSITYEMKFTGDLTGETA